MHAQVGKSLMNADTDRKIQDAEVPESLKTALTDLVQAVHLSLPDLPEDQRDPVSFMLDRVVEEGTVPDINDQWWEVALDLIAKGAYGLDEAGQAVRAAIDTLAPLMRQQLGPYEGVTLRDIRMDTVRTLCRLSDTLTWPKKNYVAPNAISLAQAHFNPYARFWAIYAGKAPVGFLVLEDPDENDDYFLWRFMIAEPYHGRGYGRQAMERLIEYVKTRPGGDKLVLCCGQGEGSPEGFYLKLGFEHTGGTIGDEVILQKTLV
jgi:diamine N-acetyltransferase